jgi:hypothetical protein
VLEVKETGLMLLYSSVWLKLCLGKNKLKKETKKMNRLVIIPVLANRYMALKDLDVMKV